VERDQCYVLVVDDDADTRGALVAILEAEGYQVAEAEHGLAALERLRESRCPCVIVLDLFMPKMNGWRFREEQRRDPSLASIPVIVISADPTATRQVTDLGVEAAMTKPLDYDQLLTVVERYC
jgi:CheY-like chemotaxis protein